MLPSGQARAVDSCVRVYRRAQESWQTEGAVQVKQDKSKAADLRHILAAQLTSEDASTSACQEELSQVEEPDTRRSLLSSSIERFLLDKGAPVDCPNVVVIEIGRAHV